MYKLTNGNMIIRLDDNAFIPTDEDNNDYQEYLKWVALGNTADPADPIPKIVKSMDPRQIRQALTKMNLRDMVETHVAAGSQDLKDWWQWSPVFLRDDDVVAQVAKALNVDDATVDQLWDIGTAL